MSIRSLLPLFAAASMLSMFGGCTGCEGVSPPDAPPDAGPTSDCMLDSDCEEDFLCVDGFCTPDENACDGNADCDGERVCRDGQCTDQDESGECDSDEACAPTERCTTTLDTGADCLVSAECAASEPGTACDDNCWGHCVSRPACDDESDCEITEQCDPVARVCVPMGDCDVDGDCPITASCIDGVCTDNGDCTVDEDCAGVQSCIDGECTRNGECEVDSECPEDQRCDEALKVCERREPCTSDDECAADEICDLDNDGGTCTVIGDCDTVDDCPTDPEIACLEGICTRAECGRDSDCNDGLFCNGEETCNPRVGCENGPSPLATDLASCADQVCDEVNDVVVVTPVHARCGDNSPCTDDVCVPTVGCTNPLNAFTPAPGPVGDCVQTVCLDGTVQTIAADNEAPSDLGTADDCRTAICSGGTRQLISNDNETPPQGPTNDCTAHVCREGTSVAVAADDEVPPQNAPADCQKEICSNRAIVSVADDSEVLVQAAANDCVTNQCVGGVPSTVANNAEIPTQASSTDCQRETCVNKLVVSVADDSETLLQAASNDCVTNQCVGGVPSTVANNSETPPQAGAQDCQRQTCVNKQVVSVADNTEVLTQTSPTDCRTNQCVNGAPSTVANNNEVLQQTRTDDCLTNQCVNGAPGTVANNNETPPQGPAGDCRREVCSGGVATAQINNNDTPTGVGCARGVCTNGTPSTPPNDDFCAGADVCFADGSCNTPATLTCRTDDNVTSRKVLEHFPLEAIAANARAGTTFVWDLAGVPVNGDPQAHLITNATSRTAADFQATAPSVGNTRDYILRVTMNEPGFPAQSCTVALNVQPLPDNLQVTLFMNDGLDVDVHLTGGVGSRLEDMRYHESHLSLGSESRNCYWNNCAVCSGTIEGQTCTVTGPSVDFSNPRGTASYSDTADPQLDIDNVRGCFTATNGERNCVPEKITVEDAPAGTYFAWAYLWGAARSLQEGSLSSPAVTTARLEITCRGQTISFNRTLRSDATDGSTTAAPARSARRYGGASGDIRIVIPTNVNQPCTITD